MRLESQRTLHLPSPPEDVWPLVSDPSHLPVLVPEVEDAWYLKDGRIRLVCRLGRRHRTWNACPQADEAGRRLELSSASEGVRFSLRVSVEKAAAGGTDVKVSMELEPPEVWGAAPRPGGIPRRAVERLLLSALLFALSAFGVLELPALRLPPAAAAVAYAVVGLSFVIGAALLSSAHGSTKARKKPRRGPWPAMHVKAPKGG